MLTMQFRGNELAIHVGEYGNGRVALTLHGPNSLEFFCKITVNLPDEPLGDGEVFVKNWSENSGMVEALIAAGLAQPTGRLVPSGYVDVPVCRLTGALAEAAKVSF